MRHVSLQLNRLDDVRWTGGAPPRIDAKDQYGHCNSAHHWDEKAKPLKGNRGGIAAEAGVVTYQQNIIERINCRGETDSGYGGHEANQ